MKVEIYKVIKPWNQDIRNYFLVEKDSTTVKAFDKLYNFELKFEKEINLKKTDKRIGMDTAEKVIMDIKRYGYYRQEVKAPRL